MDKKERNYIINTILFPILFIAVAIIVYLFEMLFGFSLSNYGIYPRSFSGLKGILFAPFLHGNASHLINNAIPLFILGTALFYFYKEIAVKVFFWIFFMCGFWTWVSARESYHIGASGIVYGLFSFLLFSGFIRKHLQLISISFFVVFVYGSMVWGIFPIKVSISFEGHLWGFVAGIILAFYYKNEGPQKKEYHWEEDEDVDTTDNQYYKNKTDNATNYIYIYKENDDDTKK